MSRMDVGNAILVLIEHVMCFDPAPCIHLPLLLLTELLLLPALVVRLRVGLRLETLMVISLIICLDEFTVNHIELFFVTVRIDIILLNIVIRLLHLLDWSRLVHWDVINWGDLPVLVLLITHLCVLLRAHSHLLTWSRYQNGWILKWVQHHVPSRRINLLRNWLHAVHWATTHSGVIVAVLHDGGAILLRFLKLLTE